MKKVLFNYNFNTKYTLTKINIYAYSFFATNLLIKNTVTDDFSIDLGSIISHISDSIDDNTDKDLELLRHENHQQYYKINVKFLTGIDKRYRKIADKILKNYAHIDSKKLLTDNLEEAIDNQNLLKTINISIDKLCEKMKEDLLIIMNYVDAEEKKLDLSFLDDSNIVANKLKKHYESLLMHKCVINMDNLNLELKRQRERLGIIKQLKKLIKNYMNNRDQYLNKEYDVSDLMVLRKNLSIIIGEYIYLLTHQEFHDVRKVYQGLLKKDYTFVNDFIYTYKIIMDKIWKHCLTPADGYIFDFNYLVCMTDSINEETKIGLMNRANMDQYKPIGYICSIEDNIFDTLVLSKQEILNLSLPHDVKDKYEFSIVNNNRIKIECLYNMNRKHIYNDKYDVIELK